MNATNGLSDNELIEGYLDGEDGFLSLLIDRYVSVVFSFVFHMTKDVQKSEDITQETFVKVWKNLKKYDIEKKFKVWLFTIARNTTLDYLKKNKSISFSSFENEEGDNVLENTLEDSEIMADDIFDRNKDNEEIKKIIDELKPAYKQVIFLHYYQEMTFDEIGMVMKVPLNTTKSWHRRALQIIRSKMHQNQLTYRISI